MSSEETLRLMEQWSPEVWGLFIFVGLSLLGVGLYLMLRKTEAPTEEVFEEVSCVDNSEPPHSC